MKCDAILLLGPTGSGKTPLGGCLAEHGLFGRRCVHFDFGSQLRHAAAHGGRGLTRQDAAVIRDVLEGGALLENETFHIARVILDNFITDCRVSEKDYIVLNGLPRHIGQARDLTGMLEVRLVLALECAAETVHERIATNSGGDRAERTDDSVQEIRRKLEIYAERTCPLIDHYREAEVPCHAVTVGVDTMPADIVQALEVQQSDSKRLL